MTRVAAIGGMLGLALLLAGCRSEWRDEINCPNRPPCPGRTDVVNCPKELRNGMCLEFFHGKQCDCHRVNCLCRAREYHCGCYWG